MSPLALYAILFFAFVLVCALAARAAGAFPRRAVLGGSKTGSVLASVGNIAMTALSVAPLLLV
jgi:uncharacterized membrane protein